MPVVPWATVAVVTARAARTVMVSARVAVSAPADVARTVMVLLVAVVGVPEITPALLNVSPAGNAPEARAHVMAVLSPPLEVNVVEYGEATVPSGTLAVATTSGLTTLILNVTDEVIEAVASVAVKVADDVPEVVGVPLITPA